MLRAIAVSAHLKESNKLVVDSKETSRIDMVAVTGGLSILDVSLAICFLISTLISALAPHM